MIALAILFSLATLQSPANLIPKNLELWNRSENHLYPQHYWEVKGAAQAKDGYNCMGLTALKARDLHRLGYDYSRLQAVFVDNMSHMVLLVDGVAVLDQTNWLESPTSYRQWGPIVPVETVIFATGVGE